KGFSDLNEIEKMSAIVRKADVKIKKWFYDAGSKNRLPEKYTVFKKKFVEYTLQEGVENCIKYRNESWVGYVKRLRYIAIQSQDGEEFVMNKCKETPAPIGLQNIFIIPNVPLDDIIVMVKDWEKWKRKREIFIIRLSQKMINRKNIKITINHSSQKEMLHVLNAIRKGICPKLSTEK
ncbi:hypothetical protein M153_17467000691, partial [Pseudoloma neurophilia]